MELKKLQRLLKVRNAINFSPFLLLLFLIIVIFINVKCKKIIHYCLRFHFYCFNDFKMKKKRQANFLIKIFKTNQILFVN